MMLLVQCLLKEFDKLGNVEIIGLTVYKWQAGPCHLFSPGFPTKDPGEASVNPSVGETGETRETCPTVARVYRPASTGELGRQNKQSGKQNYHLTNIQNIEQGGRYFPPCIAWLCLTTAGGS